jgi:molecular chaperone DnaK
VRKEHLKEIRQIDLDKVKTFFDNYVRKDAKPSEASSFDNLARTAQRAIERNENDFERHVDELRTKSFDILWCQDWYVVDLFKIWASSPHQFVDKNQFTELVKLGTQYMQSDDIEKLRSIVARLSMIRIGGISDDEISEVANTNIIRG